MVDNPANTQMPKLIRVGFRNWNSFRKKGVLRIRTRKEIAPPVTHNTALLGVTRILKILSVHDRFVRITAMFDTIKVMKAMALTSFAS